MPLARQVENEIVTQIMLSIDLSIYSYLFIQLVIISFSLWEYPICGYHSLMSRVCFVRTKIFFLKCSLVFLWINENFWEHHQP